MFSFCTGTCGPAKFIHIPQDHNARRCHGQPHGGKDELSREAILCREVLSLRGRGVSWPRLEGDSKSWGQDRDPMSRRVWTEGVRWNSLEGVSPRERLNLTP